MTTSTFAFLAGVGHHEAFDILEWAGIEKVRVMGHGRVIWHYRSCVELAQWLFSQSREAVQVAA